MGRVRNIIFTSVSVAILSLSFSFPASAKNCKKGIPCGNSCISANKTCRIGTGYSSSSSKYKPSNTSSSANLYSSSSNDSDKYKSNASKASSLAIAGASTTAAVASSSDSVKYRCTYAKASIKNGVMGEMKDFSLANVDVNGDIFKANRPDKTTIKSPEMKKKNGNLFIETKDKMAYVMADTRNEFAVSDGGKQLTEQWTECKKQ